MRSRTTFGGGRHAHRVRGFGARRWPVDSSARARLASSAARRPRPPEPGAGKPAVVIGDKNFAEENILGSLYAQALKAQGYTVKLKDNIGSSEITCKALQSGQIEHLPGVHGHAAVGDRRRSPRTRPAPPPPSEAARRTPRSTAHLLATTPFYGLRRDRGLTAYATRTTSRRSPTSRSSARRRSSGAAPEFATRFEGLIGLKRDYGSTRRSSRSRSGSATPRWTRARSTSRTCSPPTAS